MSDEWYDFRTDPRPAVHVLATLDEGTYTGGRMGADHPIAWCHSYQGGRAFYTARGHTVAAYAEPLFRTHLLGAIRYAAGQAAADCRPIPVRQFRVSQEVIPAAGFQVGSPPRQLRLGAPAPAARRRSHSEWRSKCRT